MIIQEDRRTRRRRQTAAAILDAAERLFAERGYAKTTMSEVADHCDIAVGSLYTHFPSKDALHAAVIDRAIADDQAGVEQSGDPSAEQRAVVRQISRGDLPLGILGRSRSYALLVAQRQGGGLVAATNGDELHSIEQDAASLAIGGPVVMEASSPVSLRGNHCS
ncbi:TetR/AcrR family transcriptional regulator [Fodinicola acaciae]|uniref:TetR/AcrR family transcriptional regulator n=1 Tax=Fodinicola acaciae TaxID=2681555 RepID=UPI0013D4B494|nr:helix-turn-helix domain-containing protein [Fodinicola acaciae]